MTKINYLLICLFIILINDNLKAEKYFEIIAITPSVISQNGPLEVELTAINYSEKLDAPAFTVHYNITENLDDFSDKLPYKFDTTLTKTNIGQNSVFKLPMGMHNFDTSKKYLIKAQIVHFLYNLMEVKSEIFYQFVNAKFTDAGAFTIDAPSLTKRDGPVVVTIKNYGRNKLYATNIKWICQERSQPDIINPKDTTPEMQIQKWQNWKIKYFNFSPPIDSGDYRQITLSNNAEPSFDPVLVVANYMANGQTDFQGNDTIRCYLGEPLKSIAKPIGTYSISNNKNHLGQFTTIQEAIDYLYSKGVYDDNKNSKSIEDSLLNIRGLHFFVWQGQYEGPLELNGIFKGASPENTLNISSYFDDSTQVKIYNKTEAQTLYINGAQHFSFSGFTFDQQCSGHAVKIDNNAKDFVINKSLFLGYPNSGNSASDAVIFCSSGLDSCNIATSTLMNGSYGLYYSAPSNKRMNTVGITSCVLKNQKNIAVSIQNADYPFVSSNIINDNIVEFSSCLSAFAGQNNIHITDEKNSFSTQSSVSTYAGLMFHNCSGNIIVNQNFLCVETDNFYGLHFLNCQNNSATPSVINMNSIQSNTKSIFFENSSLLNISNSSIDLKSGQSSSKAGLYIDKNSLNIGIIKSAINSSGLGNAIILENSNSIVSDVMNNIFTGSGNPLGMIAGKNIDNIKQWYSLRSQMEPPAQIQLTNKNPNFYGDCELYVENSEIQGGLKNISKSNPPSSINPLHNTEGHNTNISLSWTEEDESNLYWLQVSNSDNFVLESIKDNSIQTLDYLLDVQNINEPYFPLYSLAENTEYFWRIRVHNPTIKISDWSSIFKFKTGNTTYIYDFEISNYSLDVYPNPSNGNFTIQYNCNNEQPYTVKIIDINGITIYTKTLIPLKMGVNFYRFSDISNCNIKSGIYLMNITNGVNNITKKIVIIE